MIRPKTAIPIHGGTFAPIGMPLRIWRCAPEAPVRFRHHARPVAPAVQVEILEPGETLDAPSTPRDDNGVGVPNREDLEMTEPVPALPVVGSEPNP
jgi:hypothetical protein